MSGAARLCSSAPAPCKSPESLFEDAPCGYLVTRPEGEILQVNRTLLAWLGRGADEGLVGQRLQSLLTVPGVLLYETHVAPLLGLRGFVSEIALDLRCRDGSLLPVLLTANTQREGAGAPALFRIAVLSAPRRREYERELVRARTQAEESAEQLHLLRELAERKVAEQDVLLRAVARLAAGDLQTPVTAEAESSLARLAEGLEQMRRDLLDQIRRMDERNAEVQQLNRELRRQIEQRSRLLAESMEPAMGASAESPARHEPSEVQPVLPRGRLLADRYRVESIVGQGGMGTVYEVERLGDGRRFAAKVLGVKPNYQTMSRFAREAQLLARMQHPNLVGIVDVDITDDQVAYLVMELVRGSSLAELSARYGDREFMLPVLLQIANALEAVHGAGAVHRDLKPGNVLIAEPGAHAERGEGAEVGNGADGAPTVKLADFGVSRLLDTTTETPDSRAEVASLASPFRERAGSLYDARQAATMPGPQRAEAPEPEPAAPVPAPLAASPQPWPTDPAAERPPSTPGGSGRRRRPGHELTVAGAILGTPLYMAPELRSGARLAMPSSDIFSFGMLAYEVLTGRLPFDQPPLLWAELAMKPPVPEPLDRLCPGLDPALARTLEACLAADPSRRPTASALVAALQQVVPPPRSEPRPLSRPFL